MNNEETKSQRNLNLGKFDPAKGNEAVGEGETLFIRRTAAAVAEQKLGPTATSNEFGLPLKEMLGVITYCYARGVFPSGAIAELLRQTPELSRSVGPKLPDEAAIRKFRRQYAAEIEEALEALYRTFPRGQDPTLPAPGRSKAEDLPHRQAGYRIHDAIWTDNKLPGHPTLE